MAGKDISSYIGKAEVKAMGAEPKASDPIEEALQFSAEVAASSIKKDAVATAQADEAAKRAEAETRRLKAQMEAKRLQSQAEGGQEDQADLAQRAVQLLQAGMPPEQVGQLLLSGGRGVAPGVGLGAGGLHFDLTMLVRYLMEQSSNAQTAALKAEIEAMKARPSGITKEDLREILASIQAQSDPFALAQRLAQTREAMQAAGLLPASPAPPSAPLDILRQAAELKQGLQAAGLISTQTGASLEDQIRLKDLEWKHERDMEELRLQKAHQERQAQLIEQFPTRIGSAIARGLSSGEGREATPGPGFTVEAVEGEAGQVECLSCHAPIAIVPEMAGGRCTKCRTPFSVERAPRAAPPPPEP